MTAALRAVALLAAIAVILVVAVSLVPGLEELNPFRESTKDRSQPVLLRSLERLSEYRAATANLQVVVDIERDAGLLPSFIKGSRTLLVAAGSVDAGVSFRGLTGRAVRVNEDRTAVMIELPRAKLSEARVDLDRTRVYDRERGLLDRVRDALGDGGADEERRILAVAQRKLGEAARADPQLLRSAEGNTRAMLEGMMRGLGFERVTIRFAPLPGT